MFAKWEWIIIELIVLGLLIWEWVKIRRTIRADRAKAKFDAVEGADK